MCRRLLIITFQDPTEFVPLIHAKNLERMGIPKESVAHITSDLKNYYRCINKQNFQAPRYFAFSFPPSLSMQIDLKKNILPYRKYKQDRSINLQISWKNKFCFSSWCVRTAAQWRGLVLPFQKHWVGSWFYRLWGAQAAPTGPAAGTGPGSTGLLARDQPWLAQHSLEREQSYRLPARRLSSGLPVVP